jgi:hypothetical protein
VKHVARLLLLILILASAWFALQPQYNTAHWTPNQTMRSLGFPYQWILAYEHNLHWFLHVFVGLVVTFLLYLSRIYFPQNSQIRIITGFLLVIAMALVTEWLQSKSGRSVEIADLAFGLAGTTIASGILLASGGKKTESAS